MKKVNGHEIIQLFEKWAPKKFALEGDSIGLHVGQLNRPVHKVLITLDVNEWVVDEAIEQEAQLIIAHHPPIFRPLKSIQTNTAQGRMLEKCIKNNISIYAAHTNLDVAIGGVNDMLAKRLSLREIDLLTPTYEESLYKLIVFCPVNAANELREALGKAGAGAIGDYVNCSFTSHGEGRFTPSEGANPYIGSVGKAEVVKEEKIEVIVPSSILKQTIKALHDSHPYEEAAYDLIQLSQKGKVYGLGRIGVLENEMELIDFTNFVKEAFDVPFLRFVGDSKKKIKKVAILGGDGNKYIYDAKRKGADVFVTGDLYYHVAHEAEAMNLAVVDPGHHIEKVMIEGVANYMEEACRKAKYEVIFLQSKVNTEPFQFK